MDTFTLEKVLTTVSRSYLLKNQEQKKILSGVYPCDSLLLRKVLQKQDTKSARAIIVNTDESNKPGTHWQAIFIPARESKEKRRRCYFFDSYGRPPTGHYIREYIKSITDETRLRISCRHTIVCIAVNGVACF